jgi:2-iminobutanoate/2-iminopropanoate deaminase
MTRRLINPPGVQVSSYTPAVRADRGGLLEISGLAAFDASGVEVHHGDLSAQTRYVLHELMQEILGEVGIGFEEVCRLSVFTTDIKQWAKVWDEIKPMFGLPPAVTAVEISQLVGKEGMVELEITASAPAASQRLKKRREVTGVSAASNQLHDGAVPILPESLTDRDWKFHAAAYLLGQGDLVFLSGLGPTDGKGNTVGVGDAGAQARQIISLMNTILKEAGGSLDDVVRVRVFATDMKNRPAINVERTKSFKEPRAVSTFVQVSALEDPDWLVMLEATAFIPKHDS